MGRACSRNCLLDGQPIDDADIFPKSDSCADRVIPSLALDQIVSKFDAAIISSMKPLCPPQQDFALKGPANPRSPVTTTR